MIFNLNPNNNRASYVSRKRFFVTLLFLNTFLGCIYFIHEQKDHTIIQNAISTTVWNNSFNREQHNQYLIKTNQAIQFIQNTLENEYNREDLIKFYYHVQNEYSLGLKCTRKQNISQAMNISNVKNPIQRNNRRTSTTVR
jgi:regulatory protein YycI of two-component signal transduction system YycFG